ATLGDDRPGHDLGRGRLPTREVRHRTGLLRARLPDPQTARQDHPRVSEGPQSAPPPRPPRVGRWGAGPNPPALRPAAADRRLRADGLRWLADRVPAHGRVGGSAPAGWQRRLGPDGLGDGLRASGAGAVVVLAAGPGNRRRVAPSPADAGHALAPGPDHRRRGLYRLRAVPSYSPDPAVVPGADVL